MLVTVSQMQKIEQAAFAQGVDAANLMEEAGAGIASVVEQFFPIPGTCVVYCGKGHNGGDVLVAARFLAVCGWKILVRGAFPIEEMTLLSQSYLQELRTHYQIEYCEEIPHQVGSPLVILDGLLGIGFKGEPQGSLVTLIQEMRMLRQEQGAFIVAADVPSGLDATTGIPSAYCVKADVTVSIAYAKTGLLADTATNHVGRLTLVPLSELIPIEKNEGASLITSKSLQGLLPRRSFDVYKGTFGHVGIIAGSRGYLGAARLACRAALHGGAGLVTLYALPDIYELLAVMLPPEIMVKPIKSYLDVLSEPLKALAIGPGLGLQHVSEILEVITQATLPCVIDADALNALASEMPRLLKCQGPRLLTPHPGEMERLFPVKNRCRSTWVTDFVTEYPVTLLLKGARTIIAEERLPLAYNTTGNPGMASGGMGDVLTGVTAALLAGGHSPHEAAMLGAWLCGRAAEQALLDGLASEESLTASDIIDHLGSSFQGLREGAW